VRTLTFPDDLIYAVEDGVATVKIRIHPVRGQPYEVDAVLDTGAAVSRFSPSLLPDFGIAAVDRNYIEEFQARVANNQIATAYIHEVPIEFDGRMLTIKAAFCPVWGENVKNLLGLDGFLDGMIFGFEHRGHSFFYSPISSPIALPPPSM
jgi:hypothetical protein